jgi:anaerobic selenocysteine-containing dehydrogenase
VIATTAAPNKTMTILYALGWTEHSNGSQNIRCMAMVQLLLGNMGMAGGGINALRGHSNVQGITDMCLYAQNLPGYLGAPTDADKDSQTYLDQAHAESPAPGPDELPAELPEVVYQPDARPGTGDAATAENDFAYDYCPKLGGASDACCRSSTTCTRAR